MYARKVRNTQRMDRDVQQNMESLPNPLGWLTQKTKQKTKQVLVEVWKLETVCIGGNVKQYSHYDKQ